MNNAIWYNIFGLFAFANNFLIDKKNSHPAGSSAVDFETG